MFVGDVPGGISFEGIIVFATPLSKREIIVLKLLCRKHCWNRKNKMSSSDEDSIELFKATESPQGQDGRVALGHVNVSNGTKILDCKPPGWKKPPSMTATNAFKSTTLFPLKHMAVDVVKHTNCLSQKDQEEVFNDCVSLYNQKETDGRFFEWVGQRREMRNLLETVFCYDRSANEQIPDAKPGEGTDSYFTVCGERVDCLMQNVMGE